MSFSNSSQKIYLMGNILHSTCQRKDGSWIESEIVLDDYIGNIDGELKWGKNNFTKTSRNINVEYNILRCESKDRDGNWKLTMIDLDERITNNDGKLKYK